ncbi:DUF2407 C-terminal domain-containing protein [Macrophomina phaseolina]|uniref:DUF2407 C-terminal domain-containing protein n=1 Tax=Macrophomina phaseolina TaxID=35725 RepID=A0ABQ8GUM6_9PEZI|nr:DUF2407 C-terminal domain-containing protein [Macrophomina phaseolina]
MADPPPRPPPAEILLIVRFTASIPDLPLPIPNPRTTTTLSLKQLIRTRIPAPHASSRLRLIHAGKVLADTAPLTSSLSLPPPPPPRTSKKPPPSAPDVKGKGKQPVREDEEDDANKPEPRRVYIHCSIGDALAPAALDAEASAAASAEAALEAAFAHPGRTRTTGTTAPPSSSLHTAAGSSASDAVASASIGHTSTTEAPRGFDRLLSTGFTPAEVQQLRSQFRANLSFTHTPDTMPSPEEIRVLEDRWLDNDMSGGGRPGGTVTDGAGGGGGEGGDGGGGGGGGGGWGSATWSDNGGLDDMLYGNVVGFFWPLGALGWGFREEGVWSRRRQIAVLTGFLLNIIFGFLRLSG